MSGFEFIFSLFGLILGLALAEGLGGLAKAMKASHKVRIGWPTALLGLFVSCDVVTFWMYGWAMQGQLPLGWPVMFGGFVVTAIYYVAASLVFPDDPEGWSDLNAHFDKHRRKVIGGIFLCNIALIVTYCVLVDFPPFDLRRIDEHRMMLADDVGKLVAHDLQKIGVGGDDLAGRVELDDRKGPVESGKHRSFMI